MNLFTLHEWRDPENPNHVNKSKSIWSSDGSGGNVYWVASFGHGHCDDVWEPMYAMYVREIEFEREGFFDMGCGSSETTPGSPNSTG